jgi:hypothetical protein
MNVLLVRVYWVCVCISIFLPITVVFVGVRVCGELFVGLHILPGTLLAIQQGSRFKATIVTHGAILAFMWRNSGKPQIMLARIASRPRFKLYITLIQMFP